jgi:aryl-alcohol dehydrogenase-like predicted oxidoreductase
MQTRPLGQSGIEASVVGFGAWAIGGWMWGGTDESESIRAIHAGLDAGMNLIDTAAVYGLGLSEMIVGKAIRDRRDRVVLATKCSMVCDPSRGVFKFRSSSLGPDPNGHVVIHISSAPDSIRREVEDSLKRLQTDYIDLYQTHWQDTTTPFQDTMAALLDLKRQGNIRAIGVCNASCAQMDAYREAGPLDSDQEHYSMILRRIEEDQLPYCREHGIAVLAYSPLARGLLTGKAGPERQFDSGDHRSGLEMFRPENRLRVAAMLDRFRPIAEARGITLAQLALAWTVAQPGLTHALSGVRTVRQAQENAAAGDIELTAAEFQTMNLAIDEYADRARTAD